MVAEFRCHHVADFALLELVDGVFHRLGHRALFDHDQVAALRGRTGIFRLGLGDLGEIGRVLAHFGQDGFGLGLGGGLVGGAGVLLHGHQDVAGAAGFFARVAFLVLRVVGGDIGIADGHLRHHGVAVEDDVFDLGLFRHFEHLGVLVVVGLDHVVRDLDLGGEFADRQHQFLHFAFLRADVGHGLGDGTRGEAGVLDGAAQLLEGHVTAHALIVHGRGHALRGQDGLVALQVELALATEHFQDGFLQGGVGHGQVGARHFRAQGALGDHLVQDVLLEFRGVEQLLVELGAQTLAIAFQLTAQGRLELLLRQRAAVDLGDRVGIVTEALVAADTDQRE